MFKLICQFFSFRKIALAIYKLEIIQSPYNHKFTHFKSLGKDLNYIVLVAVSKLFHRSMKNIIRYQNFCCYFIYESFCFIKRIISSINFCQDFIRSNE